MTTAGRHWHPNHRHASTLPVELRRTGVPAQVRAWVDRECGSPVVRMLRLAGASSTAVHLVWLRDGRSLVVRRYAWPFVLADEPVITRREVAVLETCAAAGLPTPRVVAADLDGATVGDGVPVLLMTRIPGRSLLGAAEGPMAEMAVRVHTVGVAGLEHAFQTWVDPAMFEVPPRGNAALWQEGFSAWLAGAPGFDPVLIHRDYHPGNLIWHRAVISGVVDWANGCAGPAGLDVSTCWWNLIGQVGLERADAYVQRYEALTGSAIQWFWMLDGLMSPGPSDWRKPEMAAKEPLLRLVLDRMA